MVSIQSKTLCNYYGENPNEYYLKFIHHNIDVAEDSLQEYERIEKDFKNIFLFNKEAFIIYFSDVDNYLKITKHIDIGKLYENKIYLRIRDVSEYNKLKQYDESNKLKIIINLSDIDKLNITDFNLVVQIDTISELSIEKLNQLSKNYRIKEVLLGQIAYLSKEDAYLYDIMSKMYNVDSSKYLELEKINKITNDIYKFDDYKKTVNKITETLKGLNIKNKEDGLYKIFYYIANNVYYDDSGVNETKIENQNLIGPLFNMKAVCEGYSKLFQQMLSLINVSSIVVAGGGSKEDGGHVWNQVCIKDNWYNADVTTASYNIHNGIDVNTYLVKDDVLWHKATTAISNECNEDYQTTNHK